MKKRTYPLVRISLSEWLYHHIRKLTQYQTQSMNLLFPLEQGNYPIRMEQSDWTPVVEVPINEFFEQLDRHDLFSLNTTYYISLPNCVYVDMLTRTTLWKPNNLHYWAENLNSRSHQQGVPSEFFRSKIETNNYNYSFTFRRFLVERLRDIGMNVRNFEKVILHHAIPDPLSQHQIFASDITLFLEYMESVSMYANLESKPYAQQYFWQDVSNVNLDEQLTSTYRYMTFLGRTQVALYDLEGNKLNLIPHLDESLTQVHDWKVLQTDFIKSQLQKDVNDATAT